MKGGILFASASERARLEQLERTEKTARIHTSATLEESIGASAEEVGHALSASTTSNMGAKMRTSFGGAGESLAAMMIDDEPSLLDVDLYVMELASCGYCGRRFEPGEW